MNSWQPLVRPPLDGEAVKSSVASRGHRDNEQRTAYLKSVLDAIEAGRAIVIPEQVIDSTLGLYTPVYLATDGTWKAAKAELASMEQGSVQLTERSCVGGLILTKDSATVGSIIIGGTFEVSSAALAAVIEGTLSTGAYYLSSSAAGKITRTKHPAGVNAAIVYGPNDSSVCRVIVNTLARNELEEHTHYHFNLTAAPAGDPACSPPWPGLTIAEQPYPDYHHTIDVEDQAAAGWLPVSSTKFDGMTIPDGAKFGYNIDADAALSAAWPPVPQGYACVTVNQRFMIGNIVEVNEDGIWWMDDTYGRAPWSPNYLSCDELSSESSIGATVDDFKLTIELWFSKFSLGAPVYVATLTPADGSITVTDLSGVTANAGDVQIKVTPLTPVTESTATRYAMRSINFAEATYAQGTVVPGVKSLSSALQVVGQSSTSGGYAFGLVTLDFVNPIDSGDQVVRLVALNNVSEESGNDILRLRFPAGTTSSIRAATELNNLTTSNTYQVVLRLWFLSTSNGTVLANQNLTLTYRRMPAPGATGTALPVADTSLAFATLSTAALAAGSYIEAVSVPITVEARDTLFFTVQAASPSVAVELLRVIPQLSITG